MPSEQAAKRLQPEALEAFLDGILAELAEPADPAALDEIRAAFRKRVPFSKRSYAAAALIMRAAGLSRGPAVKAPSRGGDKSKKTDAPRRERAERGIRPDAPKTVKPKEGRTADRQQEKPAPRPRYSGEATTLFVSMGKRQRLYPRVLIDLVMEVAALPSESIGEVRAFDNYSFVDIEPAKADAVIASLNGYEVRGRKLAVNLAKKKDGSEAEVQPD